MRTFLMVIHLLVVLFLILAVTDLSFQMTDGDWLSINLAAVILTLVMLAMSVFALGLS